MSRLFAAIGRLSAPGSVVFHDAITASYVKVGIAPGGAPFVSGSDDYAKLWAEHGGFRTTFVRNFQSVHVDRSSRSLILSDEKEARATPAVCRGKELVLFVESEKTEHVERNEF